MLETDIGFDWVFEESSGGKDTGIFIWLSILLLDLSRKSRSSWTIIGIIIYIFKWLPAVSCFPDLLNQWYLDEDGSMTSLLLGWVTFSIKQLNISDIISLFASSYTNETFHHEPIQVLRWGKVSFSKLWRGRTAAYEMQDHLLSITLATHSRDHHSNFFYTPFLRHSKNAALETLESKFLHLGLLEPTQFHCLE